MTIPVQYIRSSSYTCHDMCPMKFFSEYVLGWPGPSNMKADKGTIVHKVMEIMANIKLAKQNKKRHFTDPDVKIKVSTTKLAEMDLDAITDSVFGYYVNKFDHHNWSEKDLKECTKWVHKAVDYQDGLFDPRNLNIVAAEQRFNLEIEQPWAVYDYEGFSGLLRLQGTMDLITEPSPGVYELVDWKTGRRLNWATGEKKEHSCLRTDPQLRIYHYAMTKLFPEVDTFVITIFYINDGGAYTVNFNRGHLDETEDMVRRKFESIRDTKQPELNKSWKCRKFCHAGMSTFEGTNVIPITEKRMGQPSRIGQSMTKCEQIKYVAQRRELKSVIQNMSADGHDIGLYKEPG